MEWVEGHLSALLVLVSVIAFAVRAEQRGRDQSIAMVDHAERMALGFSGVNERLDALNEKVYDHEKRVSRIEGRAA